MIQILYEDNHLLVVVKPINMPVQMDSSKDLDLLNCLKQMIKNRDKKPGNVYLGLVHRLDRPVSGVMVFAKTSKAASRLSEQVRLRKLEKTYLAIVKGKVFPPSGTLTDKLKKNPKTNLVTIDPKGKEATLKYQVLASQNNLTLVQIHLITGRSHQIRVQFANHKNPLYGDQKYDPNPVSDQQICLFAKNVTFYHPITKEKMTFSAPHPSFYPWNLFHEIIEKQ